MAKSHYDLTDVEDVQEALLEIINEQGTVEAVQALSDAFFKRAEEADATIGEAERKDSDAIGEALLNVVLDLGEQG
jgi:hypothetical protein